MSEAEEVKLDIKVVINKEKTKVLFAEAGSDFTDVLLSFLLLPLGTILKVLKEYYGDEAPVIGSLKTLYNGVANLDSIHFRTGAAKQRLLIPTSYCESDMLELRVNVYSTQHTTSDISGKTYNGVFTESASSFVISDDLRVMPNVAGSIIKTLSNLGIDVAHMDGAETRNVTFGLNEIMALLKGSLVSPNPLSALLLPGSQIKPATVKAEQGNTVLHEIDQTDISVNNKKMILKVMLQNSSNELLFVQADDDFINFIFGVLTVPLGRVESYLGSNTGLKCVDNLHRSIADNFDHKHLKSPWIKDLLIKPTIYDPRYVPPNEFFPLNFNPKRNQDHVKGSRMYMVRDDLTVAPLGLTSTLSVLNGLKISLSDVKEFELQVGLDEGLSIVKAALTSTTALTDGLIKPIFKKQPKQQK
ncbi:hypothetical protein C2S53_002122 [Perilla frutescens var. hirtella]|uniref:DUF674 family protein n=1 Tax=Perilla frutescens var. hirtella TaxID=608512 RepID=A0AAD4IPW6_PERFH|nr:hypothetical protein C2S53_002122 [Perilla frutescens var. hirtella]